jgi:transcriptional regulator with XRE-family HTH domain
MPSQTFFAFERFPAKDKRAMDIQQIGERIRRYRRESKKTLLEVATEAHLSVGFLSQVERNLTGVSLSSLANLASALKVPLGALLDQPKQEHPDSRQGQRREYVIADDQQRYERLSTSFPGSLINAVKVWLPVGYRSEWVSHEGDEFVYVLSGHVRYTIGKKEYPLTTGDSFHFDGHRQHRLANIGETPADLISIGTLKLFDDNSGAVVARKRPAKKAEAATPKSKAKVAAKTIRR